MRRLIYVTGLCIALIFSTSQRASAQFATFDASNLAQSILGFLQDGDNMVINTEQFLQNLGVAKEQLEFLEVQLEWMEQRQELERPGHLGRLQSSLSSCLDLWLVEQQDQHQ